jgi:hypothetical protein
MKVRFLLDENLSPRLKMAVLRLQPDIDILRIGEPNTLPFGSLDPDVLVYLERSQRLLITDNRASMPEHLNGSGLSQMAEPCPPTCSPRGGGG